MKRLNDFNSVKKGDFILRIETVADWQKGLNHYKEEEHVLQVTRINKKSISIKFVKGYMKNSESKLIKDYDYSNSKTNKYYLLEGDEYVV